MSYICNLVEVAKDFNESLVSKIVISCAPNHVLIHEVEDAQNLISEFAEYLQLLETIIRDRKTYRDALLQGMGVVELDNKKAITEIQNLVNEILESK